MVKIDFWLLGQIDKYLYYLTDKHKCMDAAYILHKLLADDELELDSKAISKVIEYLMALLVNENLYIKWAAVLTMRGIITFAKEKKLDNQILLKAEHQLKDLLCETNETIRNDVISTIKKIEIHSSYRVEN